MERELGTILGNAVDVRRLWGAPLVLGAISGAAAYIYSDQVIAYISTRPWAQVVVYFLAGVGLGSWLMPF